MQQYILAALPSLISGIMMAVAGALGGYFVGKKKTQDKEAQAMKDGVKGLLRKATLELGLHYLKEGAVPLGRPHRPQMRKPAREIGQ